MLGKRLSRKQMTLQDKRDAAPNRWTLSAPGIHGECVPMRDLSNEEVDFCIVGAGAGGGVLGAKLAEAGFSVAILDAGPHWNPVKDFVSDEAGSRKLYWTDERITGGDNPVELGSNNSGQGVGGSTVHYSMVAMRAHPEDFLRNSSRTCSNSYFERAAQGSPTMCLSRVLQLWVYDECQELDTRNLHSPCYCLWSGGPSRFDGRSDRA